MCVASDVPVGGCSESRSFCVLSDGASFAFLEAGGTAMFRRILVATDFSESSSAAFRLACELARPLGTLVELLHVCQLPRLLFPDGSVAVVPPSEAAEIVRRASSALQAARREADPHVVVGTRLLEGAPADAIVGAAEAGDLIVMGTRGRTGLSHLVLGSVAEQVLRHARCPVLTVSSAASAAVWAPAAHSAQKAG
jgi:nucleotide-binding universal stress UspA family protein